MHSVKPKDAMWSVVIVSAFLLAYYVLYSLSFIYLRPYINYYLSIANSSRVRVFNLAMLVIFLSSPFNAYEAKVLHTNPTTYFAQSVIASTSSMFALLTVYYIVVNYAMVKVKLRVRPMIGLVDFTLFAIAASLLDSWIVSLARWLLFGAPSAGTSIYAVFQFTAMAYVLLIIITQATKVAYLTKIKPRFKPPLNLILAALITAIIMGALAYAIYCISTEYVPLSNINHAMGLVVALIFIGAYHVLNKHPAQLTLQGRIHY